MSSPHPPDVMWVYAAPRERQGAPDGLGGSIVELGVGKTEATLALTQALSRARPALVVNFGVCGVYPGAGLAVGDGCIVHEDVLADEGVATEGAFLGLERLGLGREGPFSSPTALARAVAAALGLPMVRGATVSTCSGTDELARAVATRTGARVESMEGASVLRVCEAFAVPCLQVRTISNRAGRRDDAGWDLEGALEGLRGIIARLATAIEQGSLVVLRRETLSIRTP